MTNFIVSFNLVQSITIEIKGGVRIVGSCLRVAVEFSELKQGLYWFYRASRPPGHTVHRYQCCERAHPLLTVRYGYALPCKEPRGGFKKK